MTTARADYPALTGLRAIAASVVFANHIGYLLGHTSLGRGWAAITPVSLVGVYTFFVLSGFLLAQPASLDRGPRAFWRRRAARILPVYWLALVGSVAMLAVTEELPGFRTIAANASLLHSWSASGQAASINLPAWSLSVELVFYAALPLAAPALIPWIRRQPRASLFAIAAACVVGSIVLQVEAVPATFPLAYLPIFLLGVHAATVRTTVPAPWLMFGAAAVTYPVLHNHALPALAAAALIGHLASTGGPAWLRSAPALRLGAWSYGFFLLHVLVIDAGAILLDHTIGRGAVITPVGLAVACFAFVIAWVLSAAVYRLVEEPARRALTRRRHAVALEAAPVVR
ncbi:Peptidoglycan/LPS O-acetylase OafA/YrhL, contains acyltransferase and SGNH-hydrolase domains [Nocardioides terrae]|uniref:Peptidoglycan/LPS O-acetylase OafA/YrhL, contains acyltransferase and SGNH-hydrolase domains n=1 Tax=Nocardioides terrae TaxID=574651 RepID=A0A1I1PC50_9ACTN|nr:acyltransferase [Nocardioides terrae]SFD05218.1 Peptidoglycan/LPS O-acetylase OafA/YrhL, contains acyltransferase and SGNH-hydrolase domains [Nocardioides terrae]